MNEELKIPKCIGIIMDGNRRWAKERGKTAQEGHREGYETFKKFVDWAKNAGVENVVFYAFSTENWKRSDEEKDFLFSLFKRILKNDLDELNKEGVRLRFVGQKDKFPEEIPELLRNAEEETKENTKMTVALALSYGGRAEIINAVNSILSEEDKKEVDEDEFAKYLWTNDIPDPDIIIRPGGERRLSNFLLWQSAYSELFFLDDYWPNFSEEKLTEVLTEYTNREIRRGK